MSALLRWALAGVLASALAFASAPDAAAQERAPGATIGQRIAVWQIDALGIDQEIVDRLESLFRSELERLAGPRIPSRREVDSKLGRSKLRRCPGDTKCLAAIGAELGVDLVVSGNVGQLGDSYIVNLKLIRVADESEVRRVATRPLSGTPDELIEAVRVAAYELVAPERLQGAVAILTDLVGADVRLDGKRVGKTPLAGPLTGLSLGEHKLSVTADNHTPFETDVRVRFQKTTRVVVNLIRADLPPPGVVFDPTLPPVERERRPWYSSPWVYAGVAVAAIAIGGVIGWQLGGDDVIDCGASPEACQ